MRTVLVVVFAMACSKSADPPPVMGGSSSGTVTATDVADDAPGVKTPDAAVTITGPESPSSIDASGPKLSEEELMEKEARAIGDLFALGGGDDGDGEGGMTQRRPGADLGKAIERQAAAKRKANAKPIPRITIRGKQAINTSSLELEVVRAQIQKDVAALKRCYQNVLDRDPEARGMLVLRFTVGRTGRVTDATARSFDAKHEQCVSRRASGWRFAIPRNGQQEPTEATFSFTFQYVPG